MAKIFNQIQKILLEKKISKKGYQIRVADAEKEIYEDKLNEQFNKKVEQFSKPYILKLRALELTTLSNDDYVNYLSASKLKKLEQAYTLKKKALQQTAKRKKLDAVDPIKLAQLDAWYEAQKSNILNPLQSRQLDDKTIKANKKVFQEEEKQFNQALDTFKKQLTEEHQQLKTARFEKLDKDIQLKSLTLKEEKEKLNTILSTIKEETVQIEMNDDAILNVEHLTMQFGGLKAVDDLSFEVKEGEIFGLIGPNGAGKTTVFNCITQFYKPTAGVITFRNSVNELVSLTDYKVHNVIKQGIVRTFQNVELIWEISILDNMLVGAHSLYRSSFLAHSLQLPKYKREEKILKLRAMKILKDLDLLAYKDFYPVGLPYGVLKKIELARTLMTNPRLIILDEPAAGLNDTETEQLAQTIKKIQKDYHCTIFLVEHDMGLVMNICDTICAISFGKKLAIGTPAEVQENDFVKEAYLGSE